MVKALIIFLIIFAGVIAGPMIAGEQGLALFQIAGYRIKMSITTFIILDMVIFLFLFLCYWIISRLFGPHNVFYQIFQSLFHYNALHRAQDAQLVFLEGDYKKAEGILRKNARKADNHTLPYLQAAQAAVNNYDIPSARTALAQAALTCTDREKLAFEIVQLRLLIKNREWSLAEQRADVILDKHPRQPEVLRLAHEIYSALAEYQKIIDILPAMFKMQVYPKPLLEQYEANAYLHLIRQLAEQSDSDALKKWWDKQPKVIRTDPVYQKEVAKQFNQIGKFDEAETLRASLLKQKNTN